MGNAQAQYSAIVGDPSFDANEVYPKIWVGGFEPT